MCNLGISVPPGFTLPTPLCQQYYDDGSKLSDSVLHSIDEELHHIEKSLNGPKFGDAQNPLLVSVRSGARVSMPGMMDTVLNIGLTDVTLEGLAKRSGNRRFALDSYRRLIQMYGDVVMAWSDMNSRRPCASQSKHSLEFDHQLTEALRYDHQGVSGYLRAGWLPIPSGPPRAGATGCRSCLRFLGHKAGCDYRELNEIPSAWVPLPISKHW